LHPRAVGAGPHVFLCEWWYWDSFLAMFGHTSPSQTWATTTKHPPPPRPADGLKFESSSKLAPPPTYPRSANSSPTRCVRLGNTAMHADISWSMLISSATEVGDIMCCRRWCIRSWLCVYCYSTLVAKSSGRNCGQRPVEGRRHRINHWVWSICPVKTSRL
jgi:hypothetical protein